MFRYGHESKQVLVSASKLSRRAASRWKASIDAVESIETDTCSLVPVLNCNPVPPDGAGLSVSADVALHHRMRMPVISICDEMTGTGGRRCDAFSIEAPVGIRCVQRQLNRHPVSALGAACARCMSRYEDRSHTSRNRVLFPADAGGAERSAVKMPLRLSHGSLALSFDLARWPETVQSTGGSRMLSTDERAY